MTPRAISASAKSVRWRVAIAPMTNPATLPRICINPTSALASPTCGRGHEVRDVALERALREVRAELEQDDERRDRDQRLLDAMPDQEDDVERSSR